MAKKAIESKPMSVEVKAETLNVSNEVEPVENTPLTVVKFGSDWKICLRNNIISLHVFKDSKKAIAYAKRMDSVDVINAVLILISQK